MGIKTLIVEFVTTRNLSPFVFLEILHVYIIIIYTYFATEMQTDLALFKYQTLNSLQDAD